MEGKDRINLMFRLDVIIKPNGIELVQIRGDTSEAQAHGMYLYHSILKELKAVDRKVKKLQERV